MSGIIAVSALNKDTTKTLSKNSDIKKKLILLRSTSLEGLDISLRQTAIGWFWPYNYKADSSLRLTARDARLDRVNCIFSDSVKHGNIILFLFLGFLNLSWTVHLISSLQALVLS